MIKQKLGIIGIIGTSLPLVLLTGNSAIAANLTVYEHINQYGFLTTNLSASAFLTLFTGSTGSRDGINPTNIDFNNDNFSWSFSGMFDDKQLSIQYTGNRTTVNQSTERLQWQGTGSYDSIPYQATGNVIFNLTAETGNTINFTSTETNELKLIKANSFVETSTINGQGTLELENVVVPSGEISPQSSGQYPVEGGRANLDGPVIVSGSDAMDALTLRIDGSGGVGVIVDGKVTSVLKMTRIDQTKEQPNGQQKRTKTTHTEGKTITIETLPNGTRREIITNGRTTTEEHIPLPEPATILGSLTLLGFGTLMKRQKAR